MISVTVHIGIKQFFFHIFLLLLYFWTVDDVANTSSVIFIFFSFQLINKSG